MTINKDILEGITITNELIDDITFMCKTRRKPTYFTRHGKLDFKNIIIFGLNFVRKSMQLELDSFFKIVKGDEYSITKQAYSQARQKILPIAFVLMADAIIKWFYGDDDFKTFKGYRLSAIDGSVIEINNSETLRETFGYVENQSIKVARALVSGIYDIENDMMITSKITRYDTGERDIAVELIEKMKQLGLKKELILFDRGYPSKKLILYLENNGIKYLMRVSGQFLKAVNQSKGADQIVTVKVEDKIIKIRVLKFMLDSGVQETLITNIFDESFGINDFKELYFKRWGIETKYDECKNRLQIENFTGDTPIAVEQDFYASIYLSNMAALAKAEANEKIAQKNEGKNLKYEYKVNTNILIGKLKDSLVLMLLEDNSKKRKKMLYAVMKKIIQNSIPIRPGRNNIRKLGLKSNKYPLNQKRCL